MGGEGDGLLINDTETSLGKIAVFTVTFDLTNRLSYSLVKTLALLENELNYSPRSFKTHHVVTHSI